MAGRNHLYIPGPTNVPHEILSAMHVPMEDHRSPKFPTLLKPLLEDLKKIFRTDDSDLVAIHQKALFSSIV